MIFNTWTFTLFSLTAIVCYATCVRRRYRPEALLVFGIAFYAFSVPAYLLLIAVLYAIVYVAARLLAGGSLKGTKRRVVFSVALACVVGALAYFKYAKWLALTIDQVAHSGLVPLPRIVVPLGISFFTFEFVHVLVDVYERRIARVGARDLAVFTMFYPTLVAGPIKRFESFVPQLARLRVPGRSVSAYLIYRIALGLFKKIVLADSLRVLAHPLVAPDATLARADYWFAVLAYAGQIYFDFSGYSDIAIGAAGLFGIAVPENFDRPYRSRSIAEFWRRWHVSLSSWIRDYIFVPLGGSRRPPPMVVANLLVAMALAGLWHGAAWTFVLWGLWHGLGLGAHRLWSRYKRPASARARPAPGVLTGAPVVLTFVFVLLGWVIFAAPSLDIAATVYRAML